MWVEIPLPIADVLCLTAQPQDQQLHHHRDTQENLPSEPRAARNKKSWKQNTRRERKAYQNETFCDLFPGSKKARIRDVTDDDFTLEMQPARWHKLSLILKAVSSVTAVLNHLQEQSVLRWRKDVNGGHKLASVAER